MSVEDALVRAAGLFRAGRLAECEVVLRALVEAQPQRVEAIELLGATLGAQRRPADALAIFERARDLRPSAPGIRYNCAQALFALGRMAEARVEVQKSLQLRADEPAAWSLMGSVLAALGDATGAEHAYRRSLQLAPAVAETHYNLAHLLQQLGRADESIAAYREAVRLRPAFAAAHNNLANALKGAGRAEEAMAHYAAAVRHDPALADAWSNYGTALREAGRSRESIPLLERAAQLRPDSAAVLNNLGIALFGEHRLDEAVARYRAALALQPDFHEARNNLGNALAALGAADEAAECYRAVIAQVPEHPDAYSNLGLLLQEAGRDDEAVASFEKALALRPDHPDALINMGYLLQEQGRLDAAIESYRRGLAARPDFARAAYNLGLALIVRGDFERGWELKELRFRTTPPVAIPRVLSMPELTAADWGGGHTLAVWGEQGIGDQLLYSTLVPELEARGQAFVLETDARLVPAFRRTHPQWKVVAPAESANAFAGCDRHIAVGSLARVLRPTLASFAAQPRALLAADPQRVAAYRARLAEGGVRTLAISWRSFQPKGRGYVQRKKSAGLDAFLALSKRADLRLLDVQYGDTAAEREAFAVRGGRLTRFEELDLFNDLEGVLAAIEACDAVVTTSNVTAHFGGVLGKPTYLFYLRANPPFHYWVPRADGRSLWYPSVRIVTGKEVTTWEGALERVAALLDA